MKRRHRFLGRISGVAVLALVLAVAVPSSSWAFWSTSASPPAASVSAATIPAPIGFACASSGGILGLGSTANYSWTGLPAGSSWRYVVHLRSADGSIDEPLESAGQTGTSVSIGQGLLTGLLGGLLELLLGNQRIYVSVSAVHPSGWESPHTAEIPLRRATILGGITC